MFINNDGTRCGCGADSEPVFLIIITITETTAAALLGADWLLVHLRPQSFYDIGRRPAGPWWNMKGYPTVPCKKATAGEQMVFAVCLKTSKWDNCLKRLIKFKHLEVEKSAGGKGKSVEASGKFYSKSGFVSAYAEIKHTQLFSAVTHGASLPSAPQS